MGNFFNITAGYQLAEEVVELSYGLNSGFVCFEDFVEHTDTTFLSTLASPQKITLLHIFLRNLELSHMEFNIYNISHSENYDYLLYYFNKVGYELPYWFAPDLVDDHHEEIISLFMEATNIIAEAAFELLFNDREFLYKFQLELKKVLLLDDTPKPNHIFDHTAVRYIVCDWSHGAHEIIMA